MTFNQKDFDEGYRTFTDSLAVASGWQQNFFGAAYSTRLREAIKLARGACDTMEKILEADKENGRKIMEHYNQQQTPK